MGESIIRKKILVVSQPAYGDSVILRSILNKISADYWEIDVLTKETFRDIFLNVKSVSHVLCCDFPIWYNKNFCVVKAIHSWRKLCQTNYDVVLDYIGDFRHRYIGFFCGGKKFVTVERENGHPFNNLIRQGLGFLSGERIIIPNSLVNIYDQIKFVLEQVGLTFTSENKRKCRKYTMIGIHPSASQKCKIWEYDKWKTLIRELLNCGTKICIFGAPQEREILEKHFGDLFSENVEIFTGTLMQFMGKLRIVDVLIGLDSFSVHAAYAVGVPNIMICGANDYRMWQTPLTKVVVPKKDCCQYWPCYNKPNCGGRYDCIKDISVEDVLMIVQGE